MMKIQLQIALLALLESAVHAASSGVNVPQTSAADYIFSRPVLTNHIKGVLVDTTDAYRVIRSEDVDWIKEAWAEREAIRSGKLRGSRLFGAGAVVSRDDVLWDINGTDWLDADAPLLAGCRLIPGSRTTTNTVVQVSYTNGWTNAVSVITMPMTNGTSSVHTNSWRVNKLIPTTSVETNVHAWGAVDYCHGVDGVPFPAYSNVARLAWGYFNEAHTMFPNVKSIAYAREILRGTKRLADYGLNFAGEPPTISESMWDESPISATTNVFSGCNYNFHAEHAWATRERTAAFTASVPTRFESTLVTTGGANRVSVEAGYARCYFSYHLSGNNVTESQVSTNAVVRLGNATLDLSGTNALCRVSLDAHGLCSACASAAGVPSPPGGMTYRSGEGKSELWSFYVESLVLFYSITPSVKLPDW